MPYFQPQDSRRNSGAAEYDQFALHGWKLKHPSSILGDTDVLLQVILSGGSVDAWSSQFQGFFHRDIGMNVACQR